MDINSPGLFLGLQFWFLFIVFVFIDRFFLELLSKKVYNFCFFLFSSAFVLKFSPLNLGQWAILVFCLQLFYLVGLNLSKGKEKRKTFFLGALSFGILIWLIGKIISSYEMHSYSHLVIFGASFLLVKIWTFLKDCYDKRIKDPSQVFMNYCTFFTCFTSGPMHQYSEFDRTFYERLKVDFKTLVDNLFLIFWGLIKVLIIARVLRPNGLDSIVSSGFSELIMSDLILRSMVFSLVIYFDFSGYSTIAIASSRLMGIHVPENFKNPYFAPNIRDFWQRWHITFSRFLTQYLFVPFVRFFQLKLKFKPGVKLASMAYLFTFGFCGLWHGSTWSFFLWGLSHAFALIIFDIWSKKFAKKGIVNKGKPQIAISTVLTFVFVSLSWTLFKLPMEFWFK